MSSEYTDRWIRCDERGIAIRGYYVPWGTRHIAYAEVVGARRVGVGFFSGRFRVWGTANPRYWANLDPGRVRKRQGIILDLGKQVRPLITPDDVDAAEASLRDHGVAVSDEPVRRGPVV